MTHQSLNPAPVDTKAGAVCWLECGARPTEALLGEVERLTAALGGRAFARVRTADIVTLEVELPAEAIAQFKGALALAGGAFEPADAREDACAVIVLIGPTLSMPVGAAK